MADKYQRLFELGSGSFGKAWVVQDKDTGQKCVSKQIQVGTRAHHTILPYVVSIDIRKYKCNGCILFDIPVFIPYKPTTYQCYIINAYTYVHRYSYNIINNNNNNTTNDGTELN